MEPAPAWMIFRTHIHLLGLHFCFGRGALQSQGPCGQIPSHPIPPPVLPKTCSSTCPVQGENEQFQSKLPKAALILVPAPADGRSGLQTSLDASWFLRSWLRLFSSPFITILKPNQNPHTTQKNPSTCFHAKIPFL